MQTTPAPKKMTPMMEQYLSIRQTLPSDTILFYRLGDFYEMFFDDAVRASEILNITLTGREAGEAGRVPMCGVPYHSFQGYVRILVQKNYKVAICEQVSDPKAGKGIVERKITRVISPATYLEDEGKEKDAEYMAAISERSGQAAIAYLDLGTGDFFVREASQEKIVSDLTLTMPKEVILSADLSKRESFLSQIRQQVNPSFTIYDNWVFDYSEGTRLLQDTFSIGSAHAEIFNHSPLAVQAAGAVLYYLRDHLHTALSHIVFPKVIDQSEYMILDRQTQKSLELVSNLSGERHCVTLFSTLDQTLTCMGGRTLQQWITHPLLSLDEIRSRQEAVSYWVSQSETLLRTRELLKGIRDMERVMSRLNCGLANGRDLVNLKIFLRKMPEIQAVLAGNDSSWIAVRKSCIRPFPELEQLIEHAIVDEPPLTLKDGGLIKPNYSAELEELRNIASKGKEWLLDFEKKEIERTGIKSLKIKYSQVFGYTIDISKSYLSLVPQEYIRKQTLANGERFILPELQAWDEKISGAEEKIKSLEYALFDEVRVQVLGKLSELQKMARAVGDIDALSTLALIAVQKRWTAPQMSQTDVIRIIGGRHPVVEQVLPAGEFVENDTLLDREQNQLVILTGPNMAGKSTYIRQTALIVLLAQIGSFVPAADAEIGIVDRIFTRIGAADDLTKGESTFMVEMLETAHILKSCTGKSLLILDEVGRGTSTFDGVSIAWAICEYLVNNKSRPRTLFATHYHELTQLADHYPVIKNYQMKVSETSAGIIFLRKVGSGPADRSYGIHVAELAGLPKEVIRRAAQVLKVLESENDQATRILEAGPRERSKQNQPTLFGWEKETPSAAAEPAAIMTHPVILELAALQLDELTPREALNKLFEMKKQLSQELSHGPN